MLIVATAAVTTATAIAFATSTGTRVGTATSVERIIPVEYSPVMSSAPSTAMVSMPSWKPPETSSAPLAGPGVAPDPGAADPVAAASTENATARETPVIRTTVAASTHHVERSESSLVNSPRTIPRKLVRNSAGPGDRCAHGFCGVDGRGHRVAPFGVAGTAEVSDRYSTAPWVRLM